MTNTLLRLFHRWCRQILSPNPAGRAIEQLERDLESARIRSDDIAFCKALADLERCTRVKDSWL